MTKLTKLTTLAASILTLSGVAYANPGAQWPAFDQVDKNKDGVIEKSEAKIIKGLKFKDVDTDRDSKISPAEYQVALQRNGQEGGLGGGDSAPQSYTR